MKTIFTLYFATRLINLLILPFFTDESSYVYTAMLIKENLVKNWGLTLNLPVVKPPLFFLLIIFFENIFSNPLLAGRLVSVFFGAVTLLGLYLLTKNLFDKKMAFFAAILYILSPFALTYDRLALMDSAMAAFSVWILFMTMKFIEKKKLIYLFILILLCTLALFTKQSGKFFLIMLPFVPLILGGKKNIKIALVLVFISVSSYLIYLFVLGRSQNFLFYNNFEKTYFNLSPEIAISNFKAILSWIKSYFPLIFIFIPFSVLYMFIKNKRLGLVLTFWTFVPIVISAGVGQYFFPRYLLPSIVLFIPFLALLFKKYLILFLSVVPSLIFDYYILTDPSKAPYHFNERDQFISGWPSGYGVKEAYETILSQDNKSLVLVEGDNGHLYSSFKLLGARFPIEAFKQNLEANEVIENARRLKVDFVLTNRRGKIDDELFQYLWDFQRMYNGDSLVLYKL